MMSRSIIKSIDISGTSQQHASWYTAITVLKDDVKKIVCPYKVVGTHSDCQSNLMTQGAIFSKTSLIPNSYSSSLVAHHQLNTVLDSNVSE